MTLTSRSDRLAALAILAAVLILLHLTLVAPLLAAYADSAAEIEQAGDRRAVLARLAAERPALEARRQALESGSPARSLHLHGAGDGLAAASLQALVKAAAEKHRAEIRSTQALPGQDEDGFRRITLRVQLSADIGALQRLLHALETTTPMLFIDNLDLRRGGRRDATAEEGPLDVRFDLFGYLPGAAP